MINTTRRSNFIYYNLENSEIPVPNLEIHQAIKIPAMFSRFLKYKLIDSHIHFTFESSRTLILPAKYLQSTSGYFESFILFKTGGNEKSTETEEIINLVGLYCGHISEQHLLTFLCWIGSNDTVLDTLNDLGIIIFSVLANFFQITTEKSKILLEMMNSIKFEENFTKFQTYWQSCFLSYEYFLSAIAGYIKSKPKYESSYKVNFVPNCDHNSGVPQVMQGINKLQAIDYILLWLEDDAIKSLEIPELDSDFIKVKKLINNEYISILPTNTSALLAIINKYPLASKIIESSTVLNILKTLN